MFLEIFLAVCACAIVTGIDTFVVTGMEAPEKK
jgi:hypothetical protein